VHSPETPKDAPAGTPLSPHEHSFLAGVLAHLPALCALTLPLRSSYDRKIEGIWAGETYVSWGSDNKEAPIRLCGATAPAARNFEVKCVDGTANFYLALAGIIGAGARAVSERKELEIGDCKAAAAASLSEEERKKLGIVDRIPTGLMEARKAFKADRVLGEILGKELVDAYLSVNRVSRSFYTRGVTLVGC
jgi:glutamine synthetase